MNLQEEIISGVKRSDQSLAILQPNAMRAALHGRTTFMKSWTSLILKRIEIDEEYRYSISYRIPGPECTQKESCMHSLTNVFGQLIGMTMGIHPVRIPIRVNDICYYGHMPEPDISLPDPFCWPCTFALHQLFDSSTQEWWAPPSRIFSASSMGRDEGF